MTALQQEHLSPRIAWRIYAVLLFSTFVTIEAMTFQAPALPSIVRHYGVSMNSSALIILVFFVASTTCSPIMGRLADAIGRKKMLLIGLVVFSVSEFAAAVSPTFELLLAARLLQGLGVACIMPVVLAYIGFLFPDERRGMALGIFTAAMGLGATTGALLGGLLVDAFGWQIIYWLSGLLGAVGLLLIAALVPETTVVSRRRGYDLAGSLLLFLALGGLLSIPTAAAKLGPTSPYTLAALGIGVVAAALLWKLEQRVADPVIDIGILRNPAFILPAGLYLLSVMCLAGLTYSLAFFISERPGGSASQVGFINMCVYGCSMISAPIAGRLADRYDCRRIVVASMVAILLGMLTISTIRLSTPLWMIAGIVILIGFANGMKTPALMKLMMSAVPRAKLAAGSGLFTMMKDFGSPAGATFGLGVFGSAVTLIAQQSMQERASQAGASPELLGRLAGLGQAKPSPELAAQLQQLGVDASELLQAGRLDGLASAIPWVTGSLVAVLALMLLLSLRLQRRPEQANNAPQQSTVIATNEPEALR